MIKNIVFDFGGVIFDLDREEAVKAFVKIGLKDADQRLDKYHQNGIFQDLEEGRLTADEFRMELGKLCHRELTLEEAMSGWMGFITGVNLKKLDFMTQLRKQGYRVYLLSNTNPFIMAWGNSPSFTSLGKPIGDYCDKMYLSYEIGYTKPAPQIFEYMLQDSNLVPSETLFVDDGGNNIEMGQQMGLQTFQPQNATDWCDELATLLRNL